MTRMEKNASDKDGYIWDKVNYNGIIGYVARGDSKEDYIVPVDENRDKTRKENKRFQTAQTQGKSA